MDIVKGLVTSMKQLYNDINPATLTGAIDVIVVEHPNGDLVSTPFHVRFGKINVMNFVGKTVEIYINDEPTDLRMKLGASGEAFFVEASDNEPPAHLATSPIPDHPLNDLSCSPRKRSDSSPAVVIKARASNVIRKLVEEDDTKEYERISQVSIAEVAAIPKSNSNNNNNNNINNDNDDNKSVASERSTKLKKRRRKMSKPVEKITRESSSSDVEETQFVLEVEEQSSEMKTAKTTQQNNPLSSPVSGVSHPKSSSEPGGKLKEPSGNNTSNTTVTSDDEFNWNSVASGVASTRLTPLGQVVSDGDISDVEKKRERPPSPAKSDTLVELGPHHDDDEINAVKWSWGELPVGEMPPEVSAVDTSPSAKANGGQPATSERATSSQDGLYLDDVLAQTDPEMRKIYIGSCPRKTPSKLVGGPSHHLEDGESGNGPSLSQSPQSGLDSDCEPELRHPVFDYRLRKYSDLAMSLCGFDKDDESMEERFLVHLVTYDEFCLNPEVLHEPNLVFRMNGKFYNWKSMAPQLLSLAMFQTALPKSTMEKLCAEHLPKKKIPSTPQVKARSWWWSRPQEEILQRDEQKDAKSSDSISPSKDNHDAKDADGSDLKSASDEELLAKQLLDEELCKSHNKKSLRLSSDQLKSLGLQPGSNFAEFKVITAYQGTSVCSCHIYLWKSTDKVVISDIDGTITKSDVLGHILPIIGNNWAQSGVTSLFNKIVDNGYKMVYLSARAIGQAQMTRGFLRSIKQDNLWLPDGPVLLNPTSLLNALHREVVAKNPHVFKINCLKDVKQLFNYPEGVVATPFYAGFGNKTTDALSYKAVSVPVNRIFTINHKGEISQELMGNVGKTYHCLGDIADHIFPYVEKGEPQEGFNSFSFWKDPLPAVEVESHASKDAKTPSQPSSPTPVTQQQQQQKQTQQQQTQQQQQLQLPQQQQQQQQLEQEETKDSKEVKTTAGSSTKTKK